MGEVGNRATEDWPTGSRPPGSGPSDHGSRESRPPEDWPTKDWPTEDWPTEDWPAESGSRAKAREPFRTDVPHPARMYDFYLGGKDHFPADRAAAEEVVKLLPGLPDGCRANRRFMGRAVRYAAERGIRQFLDIGTGLPTAENTHEVAQRAAPTSRIVYVDNDPMVLAHARALLTSTRQGRAAYVEADFRDPDAILDSPTTRALIDFRQPVALLVVALLHFIADAEDPYALLDRYKRALPLGSVLILTHLSADFLSPEATGTISEIYRRADRHLAWRSHGQINRFATSDGWQLVPPGLVTARNWVAHTRDFTDADHAMGRREVAGYAGVSVKAF